MDSLALRITAALAACVQAGCYWPVPKCESGAAKLDVAVRRLDPASREGDAFVADGRAYASCHDFCARQPNVTSVRSCEPPAPRGAPGVVGVAYWQIACEVEAISCEEPAIVTMGSGRPFEGFERARVDATVGSWLAEMARLEAASVAAFDRLARELEAHRAPTALVEAARRAERDERRHARIARSLAGRWGVTPPAVAAPMLPVRELVAVAHENAVEGCVGETTGAMVAAIQARDATDARVRAAMRPIAKDEATHAVLAWRVHRWASERVSRADRARLRWSLRHALDGVCIPHGSSVLGLPSRAAAVRLAHEVRARFRTLA